MSNEKNVEVQSEEQKSDVSVQTDLKAGAVAIDSSLFQTIGKVELTPVIGRVSVAPVHL